MHVGPKSTLYLDCLDASGFVFCVDRARAVDDTAADKSPDDAHRWLSRGMLFAWGFNHEEAVQCFDRVEHSTAGGVCAMAHWGAAFCLGINYNKPYLTAEELRAARARLESAAALVAVGAGVAVSETEQSELDRPFARRCCRGRRGPVHTRAHFGVEGSRSTLKDEG